MCGADLVLKISPAVEQPTVPQAIMHTHSCQKSEIRAGIVTPLHYLNTAIIRHNVPGNTLS